MIGLIFPFGKKGQLGKKILLSVLQVCGFPFTKINYQHVSHTNRIKYLERVKYDTSQSSALMFIDMATLAH